MIKIKTLIIFFSILFVSVMNGQDQIVQDGENPESELDVAINPLDTNNIIVATTIDGSNFPVVKIYYTNDFGETWQVSEFNGEIPGYERAGDPVVQFDAEGNAFLLNLTVDFNFSEVITVLSKSVDGGATWEVEDVINGFTDKPWLEIDRTPSSLYYNNIYIPLVEASLRLYQTNTEGEVLSSTSIPNGEQLPSVIVGTSGDVFVSSVGLDNPNILYVSQYGNGGTELIHSTEVTSFTDYTFNAPDVSTRFQPTAYLAIDNSGDYDGRIYLAYTASESGSSTYFDVFLTYSDDNGQTWTTPTPVHSDTTANVQQFYSSIYVNDNGVLILDWYDRKNFDNSNLITDFYKGISYDGGDSFIELQLNTESMDFASTIPAGGGFGIGEYHQVVATDNTAISFWSDGRTNDQDLNIYMAKVDLNDPLVGVEELTLISDQISIGHPFPLPASESISLDVTLKKNMTLFGEILDMHGRVLWKKDYGLYSVGDHNFTIPTMISAGSYVFRISTSTGYFKSVHFVKE